MSRELLAVAAADAAARQPSPEALTASTAASRASTAPQRGPIGSPGGGAAHRVAAAARARASGPTPAVHAAHTRAAGGVPTASRSPATPAPAGSRWGGGVGLEESALARFGPALGADLSQVEIHPDEPSVLGLGTRAATSGRHVAFAPGAYRPGTPDGDRLLAHELAHVVQQSDGGAAGAGTVRAGSARPAVATGSSTATPQRDAGGRGDALEVQAEAAARLAVAGHRAPRLGQAPFGVQRDGPGEAFVGPVQRTSLAADYPGLEAALGDEDWDALEAAYERRLDVVAPAASAGPSSPARVGPTVASIGVPVRQVLSERADFVDVDVWPTVHGVLQAGGSDDLVGELLRNEMMRRFVAGLPVSRDTEVTIRLADPDGLTGGPNHLEYAVGGSVVGQTDGLIDPLDLDETFGPSLERVVGDVGREAYKVALATALLEEVPALARAVQGVRSRMDADPGDVALNEIRGLGARIGADRRYLSELDGLSGWAPAGVETLGEQIDPLASTVADMLEEMAAWREANDPGRALGEYNEEAGTALAGIALESWEEGGIGGTVVGGLAFAGAFAVAFVDAGESVLSMGFHETAIDVSRAWQRGDISGNELDEIVAGAAARAILVAAVTRGIGAATSRVGVGVAARFGLAELSLARATVVGGVAGGLTGPASLAAQDLYTRGWAATYAEGSAGRGIVERGIPAPESYLVAAGTGLTLGGLGGRARMTRIHRALEGRVTATPTGPMRVVRVDPSGAEVLEPLAARPAAGAGAGAGAGRGRAPVIDLEPVVQPDGTVVYRAAGVVETPVGPMRALAAGGGGQLVVPVGGPVRVPPGAGSLTGVEVVVVPRGWRPSPADGARMLPSTTTPSPLLPPGSGAGTGTGAGTGPLLLGGGTLGGAGEVVILAAGPAALPARVPTGRQVVAEHLRALAAGGPATASDLVRAHAATRPGAGAPVLWPPFADPFGVSSPFGALSPFGTTPPFGTTSPFGTTLAPAGTTAPPGFTATGYELFPGLTGARPPATGLALPATGLALPATGAPGAAPGTGLGLPDPGTPLLMLPAPGEASTSRVLAELPPVDVVTPDTLVWVNTRSGVYHVQGSSRFRRGTAEGVLSTVAEAERSGYRQAGAPLTSGPNVTFEGPAARGEPRYVHTGRVSRTRGARGAQSILPSAGEYPATAPVAGTHRMHPAARDLGFTPTGGYRLGPDYINTVWDRHIERYIKQLDRGSRASDEIWMTTETYTVPGTLRLQSKTYRVWARDARSGDTRRLFEITFEVDWDRWLADPSSQPPPRVTVDYVSEADVGFLSGFTGTEP